MILDVDEPEAPHLARPEAGRRATPGSVFLEAAPARQRSIEGEIRNITEFGLFIGVGPDLDGMVHMSDLSWDEPGETAMPALQEGRTWSRPRCSTSMSRRSASRSASSSSQADPAAEVLDRVRKGDVVTCVVTKVEANGIEVKVDEVLTGFIRRAELARDRADQRPDKFAIGEKVDAKVTAVDRAARRLALTIKGKEIEEEQRGDEGVRLGRLRRLARRHPGRGDPPPPRDGRRGVSPRASRRDGAGPPGQRCPGVSRSERALPSRALPPGGDRPLDRGHFGAGDGGGGAAAGARYATRGMMPPDGCSDRAARRTIAAASSWRPPPARSALAQAATPAAASTREWAARVRALSTRERARTAARRGSRGAAWCSASERAGSVSVSDEGTASRARRAIALRPCRRRPLVPCTATPDETTRRVERGELLSRISCDPVCLGTGGRTTPTAAPRRARAAAARPRGRSGWSCAADRWPMTGRASRQTAVVCAGRRSRRRF